MKIKRKRDWTVTFTIFAAGMLVWIGAISCLAIAG